MFVWAWGSKSITKTEYPDMARPVEKLIEMVVLPTPPF